MVDLKKPDSSAVDRNQKTDSDGGLVRTKTKIRKRGLLGAVNKPAKRGKMSDCYAPRKRRGRAQTGPLRGSREGA